MSKILGWQLILSILLTVFSCVYLMPNITKNLPSWWPGNTVNLGLDLRGGSHLLMNVDFENYLYDSNQALAESIRKTMRESKIKYRNPVVTNKIITFDLVNIEDYKQVKKLVMLGQGLGVGIAGNTVTIQRNDYSVQQMQDRVVDQSIEIIRMRVDSTGTKEPIIQRQGDLNILLQVPGEEDPSQLKNVLGQTAKLTIHIVDETANIDKATQGKIPSGSKLILGDKTSGGAIVIKKKTLITGDHLINATVELNRDSYPVVGFEFDGIGAKKFGEITSNNRGKRLAIVLDDKLLSAPVINEPILGGRGVITGNFTVESANELALLLRAGALPAPLKIVEERSIGPSLGADSIESGQKAAIIGFVLVVVFMVLVYGILGVFANITLVIALLYIFALLSLFQATLTLPGIAGIILTIGMAVDANVLIYERIREELRKGASNLYAVKLGFESAFATITDSNVTTLIAAFLLYSFGIGAIKGFAVTLTIGIISSMYTALIITKLMIDMWLKFCNPKNIGLN